MSTEVFSVPPSSIINSLARGWVVRYPELSARISRAIALVSNVEPGDRSPNVYFIEGSRGRRYMVRVDRREQTSSCTCQDHRSRGNRCKHILACALLEKGREIEFCGSV